MDPEEIARLAALAASGALTRKDMRVETQFRAAAPSTYDAEAHTVELTAATGTRVKRYSYMMDGYYWEQLAITPEAVNLGRVAAGQCPLLDTHNRWQLSDQLGLVEGARFEGGALILSTKFGQSEEATGAEASVAGGTLRGVSIGYIPQELTLTSVIQDDLPVYLVTQWELLEVSLCPVPADPAAGVRSVDGLHPCAILKPKETRHMDPEEKARIEREAAEKVAREQAEAKAKADADARAQAEADASAARMSGGDAIDFIESARSFGLDVALARIWATVLTPDAARAQLLQAAAEKQRGETKPANGDAARIGVEARDIARTAIPAALLHRYDPVRYALTGDALSQARQWMGKSLLEMGRYHLEQNGERRAHDLTKRELADMLLDRQNSTSDFPNLLANVANKTLRNVYDNAPQTFRAWQRRVTAPDFRQIQRTQLGDAPSLLVVPEGGQFKMGTIGEAKEVYALATYGRIFSITRQTLINDDLHAFTRVPELMGRAAADFESDAAYAPLISNPNMGDAVALFHATHANLAGSGAAIAVATVQAGETSMMVQTGLAGRPINVGPKFLIVAPKDKVPAQQLLSAVQANAIGSVNVYQNAMDLVVEARLARASGATPWFMAADYNQVDTIEYAYLEGEDGVYLEERRGFEVDGMDFKVRLDFAVKAIDYRGLYENPGT